MFHKKSEYEYFMASPVIQRTIEELDKVSDAGYEKEIFDAQILGALAASLGYRERSRKCLSIGIAVAAAGIIAKELRNKTE